jgi:signal transduction histidine kinase
LREEIVNSIYLSNGLFSGVPLAGLKAMDIEVKERCYCCGEMIETDVAEAGGVCLLIEGELEVIGSGGAGRDFVLERIQRGDFFGGGFVGEHCTGHLCVKADATTVLVGEIPVESFERIAGCLLEVAGRVSERALRRTRAWNAALWNELRAGENLRSIGLHTGAVVHDLMTPLAALMQTAFYLKQRADGELVRVGLMTERSASHMIASARTLLDFAKGAWSMEVEPIPVMELLGRLPEALRGRSGDIEVDIFDGCEGWIAVDRAEMLRVFVNLSVNAIEAMPDGGCLCIIAVVSGEEVVIEFRDNGCGMPAEVVGRIFEPFVTAGKVNGNGLGLSVCRDVVQAHGGGIRIESDVGKGTSFFVDLPVWRGDKGEEMP